MITAKSAAFFVGLTLVFVVPASGQHVVGGLNVTGTGSVSVKPEKLRLLMTVKAQGKDAKGAIVALSSHKERARQELEAMKADPESIVFSSTVVSSGEGNEQQTQMRRIQMQMMRANGVRSTPAALPTVYTASCTLRAEWPLPVQEGDALAMLPANLREQLNSRDIAGEKNQPEWNKEEKERLEEVASMMEEYSYYDSSYEQQPIQIEFVARVSDEILQTVTKQAFDKAVAEARSLSEATGVTLGKLVGLSSNDSVGQTTNESYAYYGYTGRNPALAAFADQQQVVSSATADGLKVIVGVNLMYGID